LARDTYGIKSKDEMIELVEKRSKEIMFLKAQLEQSRRCEKDLLDNIEQTCIDQYEEGD
jgi:hypothetical protein